MDKDEVLEALAEEVVTYLGETRNCAQSTFAALKAAFELGDEDGAVFRALAAFPGMAGRTETCGACSGSMLAMGLVFGLDGWGQARTFCDRFEQENGSTQCGQILEANLGRTYRFPEDYKAYGEDGGGRVCVGVVQKAVRIAGEIIFDHLHET
jgi:C_GCAxxG_C_C family probable redox protein